MTASKTESVKVKFNQSTEFNGKEYRKGATANVTPDIKKLLITHDFIEGDKNESVNTK